MFFSFFLFLVGFYVALLYNVHYVVVLLSIELILLGMVLFLGVGSFGGHGSSGVFLFLLVMVCLGGFGISLLVSLSRGFGQDYWFSSYVF